MLVAVVLAAPALLHAVVAQLCHTIHEQYRYAESRSAPKHSTATDATSSMKMNT
jgi:hypothetical protein